MNTGNEPDKAEQALRTLIEGLQRENAFPHEAKHISTLETHISWIILTGKMAYKIKKPLDLGFLNFSTLELRRHYCNEELRLNRRFAPQIYRDVVPIGGTPEHPEIGTEPAIEWAVRMHQFPAEAGLDHQIAEDRVSLEDMRRLAERVASTHGTAARATNINYGSIDSIRGPIQDNFIDLMADCAETGLFADITTLRNWTEREANRLESIFATRVINGFIRECHGDLHVGNIVRLNDEFVPFDCLEFNSALRWIDVISDIAFLVMDLLRLERTDLAFTFLNRYLEVTGDYSSLRVLPYYLVYRATVRAKITAVKSRQENQAVGPAMKLTADPTNVASYINLASQIAAPKHRPLLVVCHGVSGSGKTWLSKILIPALPAIRVRSDIIRKQLLGISEFAHHNADINKGSYARATTTRTYAQLARLAALVLNEKLNVIIDATCLRQTDRYIFHEIADSANANFIIVHCDAPRSVLEERICQRENLGTDASEAHLAVLEYQLTHREPLNSEERAYSVRVDTSQPGQASEIIDKIYDRISHYTD